MTKKKSTDSFLRRCWTMERQANVLERKAISEKFWEYKVLLEKEYDMCLTGRYHKQGKYRVSFLHDNKDQLAYYTDDLEDAFAEAKHRRIQARWQKLDQQLTEDADRDGRSYSPY